MIKNFNLFLVLYINLIKLYNFRNYNFDLKIQLLSTFNFHYILLYNSK